MADLLPGQETFTMKENGKMINLTEKVHRFILMDLAIKANLSMVKKMIVMDIIDGLMVKFIKVPSEMDLWKAMESYLCKTEKENILVNFIVI